MSSNVFGKNHNPEIWQHGPNLQASAEDPWDDSQRGDQELSGP